MDERDPTTSDVSLRDFVDLLLRRKVILFSTFGMTLALGSIAILLARPLYRTSARLIFDRLASATVPYNANDPLSAVPVLEGARDPETQIEVLQSPQMLSRVSQASGVPPGSVTMEAKQVGTSEIVEIGVQASNPEYANRFARALLPSFGEFFAGKRRHELEQAVAFAQARRAEEIAALHATERKLDAVRRRLRAYTVETERQRWLTARNAADADVQRLEATITTDETRLATLVRERAGLPEYVSAPVVTSSAETDSLKEQLTDLEEERARLLLRYSPLNPKVQEQNAVRDDLVRRLKRAERSAQATVRLRNTALAEADKTIMELETSLVSHRTLLARWKDRAQSAAARLLDYGNGDPEQVKLEADAERLRERIGFLSKDVADLLVRQKAQPDLVTLVAPALPATEISPRSVKNLAYPAVIGLILGLCLALLQEFLDERIHSYGEMRRVIDLPALAFIPLLNAPEAQIHRPPHPSGAFTGRPSLPECYRVLRANVQFSAPDKPYQSLLIASTIPGEGRSMVAANLAIAFSLAGKRVILVDANLHAPTLHHRFGLAASPGLIDVLRGEASLQAALQESKYVGLWILTAGSLAQDPIELFSSPAMHELHQDLKAQSDVVIYDSPPLLATADAQALSAYVDGVLMVVQLGKPRRSELKHAMCLLSQAHAHVVGLVFNKMDPRNRRDRFYYRYHPSCYDHRAGKIYGREKNKIQIQGAEESNEDCDRT